MTDSPTVATWSVSVHLTVRNRGAGDDRPRPARARDRELTILGPATAPFAVAPAVVSARREAVSLRPPQPSSGRFEMNASRSVSTSPCAIFVERHLGATIHIGRTPHSVADLDNVETAWASRELCGSKAVHVSTTARPGCDRIRAALVAPVLRILSLPRKPASRVEDDAESAALHLQTVCRALSGRALRPRLQVAVPMLVATIMSAQVPTSASNCARLAVKLYRTPAALAAARTEDVDGDIKSTGFFRHRRSVSSAWRPAWRSAWRCEVPEDDGDF